jgi:uncharacterized protein (DUF433 family)
MRSIELGEHIVVDSEIRGGRPVFKGTRVQVHTVLSWLAAHPEKDLQELAADFRLPVAAVQEALRIAHVDVREREAELV